MRDKASQVGSIVTRNRSLAADLSFAIQAKQASIEFEKDLGGSGEAITHF